MDVEDVKEESITRMKFLVYQQQYEEVEGKNMKWIFLNIR